MKKICTLLALLPTLPSFIYTMQKPRAITFTLDPSYHSTLLQKADQDGKHLTTTVESLLSGKACKDRKKKSCALYDPQKKYSGKINCHINPTLYKQLIQEATQKSQPLSSICAQRIKAQLDNKKKRKPDEDLQSDPKRLAPIEGLASATDSEDSLINSHFPAPLFDKLAILKTVAEQEELLQAASQGDITAVEKLVQKGVPVNTSTGYELTPLHAAVLSKKLSLISYLLDEGAIIDAQAAKKITPLHLAAHQGHQEVIKALIERGADREAITDKGNTPLLVAARNRHNDAVDTFITLGANILAKNNCGKTLADYIADK